MPPPTSPLEMPAFVMSTFGMPPSTVARSTAMTDEDNFASLNTKCYRAGTNRNCECIACQRRGGEQRKDRETKHRGLCSFAGSMSGNEA